MPYKEDTRIVLTDVMQRLRDEKELPKQLLSGLQKLIDDEEFGDKKAVAVMMDKFAAAGEESQNGDGL